MSAVEPALYVDTGILLPYYRNEPMSSRVERWLSRLTGPLRIISLTEVEFASALARIVRIKELDDVQAEQIAGLFEQECKDGFFRKMPLNRAHYAKARKWLLSRATALRTLDALHLACSHSIGAKMVTADQNLHAAAGQLDIPSQLIA